MRAVFDHHAEQNRNARIDEGFVLLNRSFEITRSKAERLHIRHRRLQFRARHIKDVRRDIVLRRLMPERLQNERQRSRDAIIEFLHFRRQGQLFMGSVWIDFHLCVQAVFQVPGMRFYPGGKLIKTLQFVEAMRR